jgi:hypothetical protein
VERCERCKRLLDATRSYYMQQQTALFASQMSTELFESEFGFAVGEIGAVIADVIAPKQLWSHQPTWYCASPELTPTISLQSV